MKPCNINMGDDVGYWLEGELGPWVLLTSLPLIHCVTMGKSIRARVSRAQHPS